MLPAGSTSVTLEMKASFLRPLFTTCGPVRYADAVVHVGWTVGTVEGRVVGADGRLCAHGAATLMAVPAV